MSYCFPPGTSTREVKSQGMDVPCALGAHHVCTHNASSSCRTQPSCLTLNCTCVGPLAMWVWSDYEPVLIGTVRVLSGLPQQKRIAMSS